MPSRDPGDLSLTTAPAAELGVQRRPAPASPAR
jgi:hypothetical protein